MTHFRPTVQLLILVAIMASPNIAAAQTPRNAAEDAISTLASIEETKMLHEINSDLVGVGSHRTKEACGTAYFLMGGSTIERQPWLKRILGGAGEMKASTCLRMFCAEYKEIGRTNALSYHEYCQ